MQHQEIRNNESQVKVIMIYFTCDKQQSENEKYPEGGYGKYKFIIKCTEN